MQPRIGTIGRAIGARRAFTLLGLAISAVFAAAAVREVDFDTFANAVASSSLAWIAASALALAAAVLLRAARWQMLFDSRTRPPYGPTLRALLIGYLFNAIMPARAGEAARIVVLHREVGSSRAEVTGTAITERVYDVLSLLAILFVAAPFLPHVTWLHRAAIFAVVVTVAVVLGVLAATAGRGRLLNVASALLSRVPRLERSRVHEAGSNLLDGLKACWHPRLFVPAVALTFASWMLIALSGWFAVLALHLGLPFGAGLLLAVTTNLAMVLPSSPGALGLFEAAAVLALSAYGVERSEALACGVVLHALNFFPYLIVGAACLRQHTVICRPRREPMGSRVMGAPLPNTEAARS